MSNLSRAIAVWTGDNPDQSTHYLNTAIYNDFRLESNF